MNTTSTTGVRTYAVRIDYFSEGVSFAVETFTVPVAEGEDIHAIARGLADRSVYTRLEIPNLTRVFSITPVEPENPDTPPPGRPAVKLQCPNCGSTDISREAKALWDVARQRWFFAEIYPVQTCENCGAEADNLAKWVPAYAMPAVPRKY